MLEGRDDILGAFALGEDRFGDAGALLPARVELTDGKVLDARMFSDARDGVILGEITVFEGMEESGECVVLFLVHGVLSSLRARRDFAGARADQ